MTEVPKTVDVGGKDELSPIGTLDDYPLDLIFVQSSWMVPTTCFGPVALPWPFLPVAC